MQQTPTKCHALTGAAGRRAKNHQELLKEKNKNILKIPEQSKNAENKGKLKVLQ